MDNKLLCLLFTSPVPIMDPKLAINYDAPVDQGNLIALTEEK